jgi:alkylation response protein AidB-like acyl-CoA dehydrogenase
LSGVSHRRFARVGIRRVAIARVGIRRIAVARVVCDACVIPEEIRVTYRGVGFARGARVEVHRESAIER